MFVSAKSFRFYLIGVQIKEHRKLKQTTPFKLRFSFGGDNHIPTCNAKTQNSLICIGHVMRGMRTTPVARRTLRHVPRTT